jgi:hypothetical protein
MDDYEVIYERFLTTREAAFVSRLSRRYLANLRYQGKGCSFFRRGRKVLYEAEAFKRWVTANPVRTVEE